jgi:hypothetical protein
MSDEMKTLLLDAAQGLDDMLATYCPELIGEPYLSQAGRRRAQGGGTLCYVAELTARLRKAAADPATPA